MNNGRSVYVYNKTRESFVATEATVADSYLRRLIGLLGKTKRWARPGRGLWIVPCHGVHTIGMLFPIDLIFLNEKKVVIHVEEHVRPFWISSISLKSYSVLELPPHTVFRTGTRVGDQLEVMPVGSPMERRDTERRPSSEREGTAPRKSIRPPVSNQAGGG